MKSFGFDQVGEKLVNRFFRRVENVVWDLMTGKVGVLNSEDEIAMLDGEGDRAEIVLNPFASLSVPIPAFAQAIPSGDIKSGDLIYDNKKVLGWIIGVPASPGKGKKETTTFKLLKPNGSRGEWRPAKIQSMGLDLSGAMVLRSLGNMLGGSLGGFQNSLLPMLMMGGGDFGDMENMLPLLLMSQMNLMGGGPSAPGVAAAGGLGMGNMLQTMMMMKMMGGMFGNRAAPEDGGNGSRGLAASGRRGYFDK